MRCRLALIALMLALPAWAGAVEPVRPKEPGHNAKPRNGIDVPKDRGMVVPPPRVKDSAVKKPPRNIDPEIDDVTGDIDQANRSKADKRAPQK